MPSSILDELAAIMAPAILGSNGYTSPAIVARLAYDHAEALLSEGERRAESSHCALCKREGAPLPKPEEWR